MPSLLRDLRYAVRMAARSPGFTALVVGVLTLGIGANSAAFAIVHALLFRPLSGEAGALVSLHSHDSDRPGSYRPFSYPNYADIRDAGPFDAVVAQSFTTVAVPAGDTMRRTLAAFVSSNYFASIGVPLAAGRAFTAAEEQPGARVPVVITGYRSWKAAGFAPSFIGSTIRVNARDLTVVGVAPEGFTGTSAIAAPEVWLPLGLFDDLRGVSGDSSATLADRGHAVLAVAARLPRGVAVETIASRLDLLSRDLAGANPGENRDQALSISPLARLTPGIQPESDAELVPIAAVAMGLCGVILLIACLNVANMLLARGASRRRETAIRAALGATRAALVRQLLIENLLPALAGAGGGLLFSYWTMRAFAASLAPALPAAITLDPRPDLTVVAATLIFAIGGTLVFALGPALQVSRRDLVSGLKHGRVAAGTRRFASGRNALVVAQIALSVGLLAAGGLFARVALAAAASDPGFPYPGALLATMDGSLAEIGDARAGVAYRQILERVRSLPGVEAAAMASTVPFGDTADSRQVRPVGAGAAVGRRATYRVVSAGYFRALGAPLLRGREFTPSEEAATASRVAIVDEALARQLFPGADALGQSIAVATGGGEGPDSDRAVLTIVAIAPPIREDVTAREATAHVYVPMGSAPRAAMHLHARVSPAADTAAILGSIRSEIRAVDPRLPLLALTTMQAFHGRSLQLWAIELGGTVLALLGALALALAVAGVYGVRSYVVSSRTREFCIRMAVGADRRDVLWLVLRDALALASAGLVLGLPLAFAASAALNAVMWGLTGLDPVVMTAAPALLVLAALAASYVPARRASRLDPISVLRGD